MMRQLCLVILLAWSTVSLAQTSRLPFKTAGAAVTGKRLALKTAGTLGANVKRINFAGQPYTDGRFTFTLDTSSVTSAGVYRLPDTVLVRTLWSGVRYPAGLNYNQWDGLTDQLTTAPAGNYIVLVQSANVRSDWEGVAGNSSFVLGNTASSHRGYQFIRKAVEVGSFIYFNQHYVEGSPPLGKFSKSTPQTKVEVLPYGTGSGTGSEHLATDGTRVYYTRYDHLRTDHRNRTWVAALTASSDTPYSFTAGTNYTPKEAQAYPESTAGLIVSDSVSNHTGGLAVQKTGNLLFVSYPAKNQIRVFNKLSGAQVSTITSLSQPAALAIDGSDNLWVISGGTTVARYAVSGNTIGAANLTLSGLISPLTVTVSTDGATVAVGDGGSSQQVKAYATSNGASSWTLGQAGGYSSTATVANDRFYFSDLSGGVNDAGICFVSDGGLWVTDLGNYRLQHFNSARTYVDNIAYITASYTHAVDQNDKTRVFDQYLEYAIDYSKPLATGYTLVRNWRNQSPAEYFNLTNKRQNVDMFGVFSNVATLSNARTYGFLKRYADNIFVVCELVSGGVIRPIPSLAFNPPVNMRADGSINYTEQSGGVIYWRRRPLTGFDGSNNPVYGAVVTEASAPITAIDPVDPTGYGDPRAGQRTASGKLLMYQDVLTRKVGSTVYGLGYHLGAIKVGGLGWQWRTSYATSSPAYRGDYPTDGSYDIGNHADFRTGIQKGYGGGAVAVSGEDLVENYYGEFWKDSQTNKWQYRRSNGLLVLTWGPTGRDDFGNRNVPGMAGGVHSGTLIPENGNLYIWHAEEGGYSGIHRWRLSNLASIKTQVALSVQAVAAKSFLALPTAGVDLLAGLPQTDTLRATTAGWSYTGTMSPGGWQLETGSRAYNRFVSPDLLVLFSLSNASRVATRTLPVSTSLTSWTISGAVDFAGTLGSEAKTDGNGNPISGTAYFDVVDNAGKVIVRFYKQSQFEVSPASSKIMANTTTLVSDAPYSALISSFDLAKPFVVTGAGGKVSVSYAGYTATNLSVFETGANVSQPASIRITCTDAGLQRTRGLGITSLRASY